jgi:phosphoribosylamine--glycine ligase
MAAEGTPFRGFLYVGLMFTPRGPRVVEFNVRLGDPEAQVILPGLEGPLAEVLLTAAAGRLPAELPLEFGAPHVGVVLASGGYPGTFAKGKVIRGLPEREEAGVHVFHAGTAERDGQIVTDGGRVLTVVAQGETFKAAVERAYATASRIHFDGMHMRRDIGRRALSA